MNSTKKYNIFFILNSPYFKFGKVLLGSIFNTCNMKRIEKIYVLNTGLTDDQLKFIKTFEKVNVLDSGLSTDFKEGSWSEDWHTNISLKLRVLGSLIQQVSDPVLMIDGDCMVTKDLGKILDKGGDIQLCYRGDTDPETPYLGSYFCVINNTKCVKFIEDCIFEMESSGNRWLDGKLWPKESKAMSKVAIKNSNNLNITNLTISEVSEFKVENIDNCSVVHFKGSSLSESTEELIQTRIFDRGFGKYVEEYINA